MYLKHTKASGGRVYMAITQSYRDINGAPRSRTIKSLGYLDELDAKYGDGLAYCKKEKKRLEAEYEANKLAKSVLLDTNARIKTGAPIRKNIGFLAYRQVYKELGLASYLKRRATRARLNLPFNQVIEYLAYAYLNGIRNWEEAWNCHGAFFEAFNFSYDEMITSLKFAASIDTDILRWIYRRIEKMNVLSGSTGYLAITNFYFDRGDCNSNENVSRFDSTVQVGMLLDSNRFPISYSVFLGSDYEERLRKHINAAYVIDMLKDHYSKLKNIIVIADKGASASDETIAQITKTGDYLFGLHAIECEPETREWMMSESGYKTYGSDSYRSKERLITRRVEIGSGRYLSRRVLPERQIAIWSKRQEGKRRTLRAPITASAFESLESDKFAAFDESLNIWADGYRLLVTSQTHSSIVQIATMYRLLQFARESFDSSYFETKGPSKNITWEEQIKAHCLISYIASLLAAILQVKVNGKYSAKQIEQTLAFANGTEIENGWCVFDHYDEALEAVGNAVGIDFGRKYMSAEEIRHMLIEQKKKKNKS